MRKTDFGKNWEVRRLNSAEPAVPVTLPHDAMLSEERAEENPGIHNIGYFAGYDYEYTKTFHLDEDRKGETIFLLFEAIYHNSRIQVNGYEVPSRSYGYTQIVVDATPYLVFGGDNTVTVVAINSDQPNSRWYSGTGIFRPVWLCTAGKAYLPLYGTRVRTISIDKEKKSARLHLSAKTSGEGEVMFTVLDPDGKEGASITVKAKKQEQERDKSFAAEAEVEVEGARFWSDQTPDLYTLHVEYSEGTGETAGEDTETDTEDITFGIRTLSYDRKNGFCVNGERVILKGACIHSDNQMLGAVSVPEAEERRVRLLQETGYNAIRSAHNPASESLLAACDRLGMYFMDEYTDCWYIHKNRYDYAGQVEKNYEMDLSDMVDKDYNHPSVVLYSTGNEVAETGEKRGVHLTRAMTDCLHRLDNTRPVTCGINIFFNFLYSLGFGVYSDEKAAKETKPGKKKQTVGSEFYNQLAGILGDRFMKFGATLHGSDVKTRDAYAQMDIAGYNYGIDRYRKDLKHYPQRMILGSETFCSDAYRFLELAKTNPGIVGDFVWAGQDYLGEAGIGSWEYEDYAPKDAEKWGWLSAGSGRIDLAGNSGGEAMYTRVALEQTKGPLMAVVPVYQRGKHTPSAWKMTDAMPSWSWKGCEGQTAKVEVYARADRAALYLNDRKVGEKTFKNDCRVVFHVPYEAGTLTCVALDAAGNEIGRYSLTSAEEETKLSLLPEEETAKADRLTYVRIRYTDRDGIWKPVERHRVKVTVTNGSIVALGHAGPYNKEGFLNDTTDTYYGNALAIVRANGRGDVVVTADDGERNESVTIPVRK